MMSRSRIALTIGFIAGFAVLSGNAAPAQASLLEFFFPALKKKEYDPTETMQAPFAVDPKVLADPDAAKADPNAPKAPPPKFALPENNTPLDQPHRDTTQIAGWLTTASSEILMFDKADYKKRMEETSKYFTAEGREQYLKFLTDNNILKVLESSKFDVRTFVQQEPLLLNQGPVNGSYRWLYEVPMMLSYVERGATSYKNVEPVNQQIVLTVQVGRTPDDMTGSGVLIERIEGRAARVTKK